MKKYFLVLVLSFFVLFSSLSQASAEKNQQKVSLGVMQGPTGFSSVALDSSIEVSVFPSPNEVVSRLINKELDFAVLPSNSVASLYNKGVQIKALAIVGEGMLSLIGTDSNAKTLYIPGAGGNPDQMADLLYSGYEKNISISAPAQLAQMVIAEKVKLAILPEPFVTMATLKNPNVKILDDVQKQWKQQTGFDNYPMSILVVRFDFYKENPKLVKLVKSSYKESINWVLSNTKEASVKIEELGIMNSSMAQPALPNCHLVYKDGKQAEMETANYFDTLGIAMTDSNLWENR